MKRQKMILLSSALCLLLAGCGNAASSYAPLSIEKKGTDIAPASFFATALKAVDKIETYQTYGFTGEGGNSQSFIYPSATASLESQEDVSANLSYSAKWSNLKVATTGFGPSDIIKKASMTYISAVDASYSLSSESQSSLNRSDSFKGDVDMGYYFEGEELYMYASNTKAVFFSNAFLLNESSTEDPLYLHSDVDNSLFIVLFCRPDFWKGAFTRLASFYDESSEVSETQSNFAKQCFTYTKDGSDFNAYFSIDEENKQTACDYFEEASEMNASESFFGGGTGEIVSLVLQLYSSCSLNISLSLSENGLKNFQYSETTSLLLIDDMPLIMTESMSGNFKSDLQVEEKPAGNYSYSLN